MQIITLNKSSKFYKLPSQIRKVHLQVKTSNLCYKKSAILVEELSTKMAYFHRFTVQLRSF